MKKYFLIWIITGLGAEFAIYCHTLSEKDFPLSFFSGMASILNPYALIYMGHDLYVSDGFWAAFAVMHTARFIWLMTAMGFEYLSRKYLYLKYVAWTMLGLYFVPVIFTMPKG